MEADSYCKGSTPNTRRAQSTLYLGDLVPTLLPPVLAFLSFGARLALGDPYRVMAVRNSTMGMTYLAMRSDRLSVWLPCLLKRHADYKESARKKQKHFQFG